MKKILFIMIMAAVAVACSKQQTTTAFLDPAGDCIFENSVVRYRINGPSNPVVTSGMEAILKAHDKKEVVLKDRKAAQAASLNDGGSAVILNDSLVFAQANFSSFEIVEQTKDLVSFKLTYPQWEVDGNKISLVRTVTLRETSVYCEVKDVYSNEAGSTPVIVVAGFAKNSVENSEIGPDYVVDWENIGDGYIGKGIVMPMSKNFAVDGPQDNAVAYITTKWGRPVEYAVGNCWSRGELTTFESWADKVRL
ncbi:MAG: DUF4861 family protein [Bacteroidales bacterium]|nr:DUF4861 family protein [Bacteroidales bacterium]